MTSPGKDQIKKGIVVFYAPLGNLVKGFKSGGAEAGCRKTMEVLQKGGYDVLVVEKPAKHGVSKWENVGHLFRIIKIWIKLISIFLKQRDCIFHVAGFYLNQIYFEWLFIKSAKLLNIKTVYEIRNGGMIEAYNSSGTVYKYFMKSTLVTPSLILCQGYDYVVFLKQAFNKDSVYYPNYIMDDFVQGNLSDRQNDNLIKLVYFGRVVPDKNVETVIDVCNKVKLLNLPVSLDIIGSYEDSYYQILNKKVLGNDLDKSVIFHGRMNFKDMYQYLKKAHFFVFPSIEKREGHSNSLTEAMGCGIVPIVSKAGFNESIVGNSDLVMSGFDADEYALKIAEIWRAKSWNFYSNFVYKRITENFTEGIVKHSLLSAYKKL